MHCCVHRSKDIAVPKEQEPAAEQQVQEAVIRNVKSMVGVVRMHNPQAVIALSSFYHFDRPDYINKLNEEYRLLAQEQKLVFIDVAGELPYEREMVYDYGHFTAEGDRRAAKVFSAALLPVIGRLPAL